MPFYFFSTESIGYRELYVYDAFMKYICIWLVGNYFSKPLLDWRRSKNIGIFLQHKIYAWLSFLFTEETLAWYSEEPGFEAVPGDQLSWLSFSWFSSVPPGEMGHDRSFPHPFYFISRVSFFHSTIYSRGSQTVGLSPLGALLVSAGSTSGLHVGHAYFELNMCAKQNIFW
jgi:hypothetical protein